MSNDNMMSQEEVEKMLKAAGQIEGEPAGEDSQAVNSPFPLNDYLTKQEQDVLGEIGNICMGTSATTMYTLLNRNVTITTPRESIHTMDTLSKEYPAPIVAVEVNYIEGIEGKNLLILKEYDVALMTDVLMGGDGSGVDPNNIVLDEMHLSAIREVMNQMVGSSATSLANILNIAVNISTPTAKHINMQEESNLDSLFEKDEKLVKISFKMEIEDLLTSEIMQVLPVGFAKQLVGKLLDIQSNEKQAPPVAVPHEAAPTMEAPAPAPAAVSQPAAPTPAPAAEPAPAKNLQPAMAMSPQQGNITQTENYGLVRNPAEVQAKQVEFPNFDLQNQALGTEVENIAMLANVPMSVTVELGKSKKRIKEILEFNAGSVVVLDKLAGEPVDILVNGRPIAKGEVVVVDDNYGVRITEINVATLEK